jgi:hypothetical protein
MFLMPVSKLKFGSISCVYSLTSLGYVMHGITNPRRGAIVNYDASLFIPRCLASPALRNEGNEKMRNNHKLTKFNGEHGGEDEESSLQVEFPLSSAEAAMRGPECIPAGRQSPRCPALFRKLANCSSFAALQAEFTDLRHGPNPGHSPLTN